MKHYLILSLIILVPLLHFGQTSEAKGQFGFSMNSSMNGEFYAVQLVPSIVYAKEKHQVEFGVGINLSNRQAQQLITSEIRYKHFPNGKNNPYNLYLISQASYTNRTKSTYYPTQSHYLFTNAGYGFEMRPFKNAFIGTDMGVGVFTFSEQSETPYEAFQQQKLFDAVRFHLTFQFNVGYRF